MQSAVPDAEQGAALGGAGAAGDGAGQRCVEGVVVRGEEVRVAVDGEEEGERGGGGVEDGEVEEGVEEGCWSRFSGLGERWSRFGRWTVVCEKGFEAVAESEGAEREGRVGHEKQGVEGRRSYWSRVC